MNVREQARQAAELARRQSYERHQSAIGTKYEHPIHGVGVIIKHRPIIERGITLAPPFIEVLLEFKTTEFWTGACFLDTMEHIK